MLLSDLFLALALLCALWSVVSAMAITGFLAGRGIKINWIFIKLYIIKYIRQYYEVTMRENGKPGPWFYSYIISINSALLLAIIGAFLVKVMHM